MSYGLRVWDASGSLWFDETTRASRVLGQVNTGTQDGSIVVPDFAQGTPFYIVLNINPAEIGTPRPNVSVDTSQNRLSWVMRNGLYNPVPCDIIYGVY